MAMVKNLLNEPQKKSSLKQYESLIANHKIFCLLDTNEVHELALLAKETSVDEGVTFIQEGALVDNIYLILSGAAKATRKLTTIEKTEIMHVAYMTEGDAIGLGEAGFFSQSGFRTASVTAVSPMHLLVFDLKEFDLFLQKYQTLYPDLRNSAEKILLMQFIQSTHLFRHLEKEKIRQLARQVEKITIPAGTVLFNKGDFADKCYFILSGKISILGKDENEQEHILKTLHDGSFFGEGAFLDGGKRNASARTETSCNLFVLDRQYLHHDSTIDKSVDVMRLQQIIPVRCKGVKFLLKHTADHNEIRLLLNTDQSKQLQLSQRETIIWEKIDGHNTLKDILEIAEIQLKDLTLGEIYACVKKFKKLHFVEFTADHKEVHFQSFLSRIINFYHKIKNGKVS